MLNEKQIRIWVNNLLEAANAIDYDDLNPVLVANLVGAAKSAVLLLPAPSNGKEHE